MAPSSYRAPWWLPDGHSQTVWAYFFTRQPQVCYRRERWEMSDGDFIDLDWIDGPDHAPLIALFHGLEGSANSPYARALMQAVQQQGWRGLVVNFRGCSGEPNRLPRAYHSGDTAEISTIVRELHTRTGAAPLFVAGVSLGANALLKWLGESGPAALQYVQAAVAVSPPFDLIAAGRRLDRGFNRITYTRHFLQTLRLKALHKIDVHRLPISPSAVRSVATLFAFDDLFTAPMHGFRNANDYWHRASSRAWLNSISTPTLIVHAQNDPFLPAALYGKAKLSSAVTLETPPGGGHVGFVSGAFPGHLNWLPQRILDFCKEAAPNQGG